LDSAKNNKKFNIKKFLRFAGKGTTIDMPLLIITLTLLCFGLVMLYSASYVKGIYEKGDSLHYISSQLKYAVLGLVVMAVASKIDYRIFRRYSYFVLILTYILLVVVLFMPEINYAKRWIFLPSPSHPIITFQPSEIAKFSVILLFADLIQKKGDRMKTLTHGVIPFVAILGSIALLMLMEPHISGTLIIMVIGVIMMFVGGTDLKWFFLGIALVIAAGVMAVIIEPSLVARAMGRIDAWLNPESDLQGGGYQSYMSLLAIGSGGLFGLGLGNSRQKHLHLPEPQNDFIFAVICEEMGVMGGIALLMLYFLLVYRGFKVALTTTNGFNKAVAFGLSVALGIQIFIIVGGVIKLIPLTGITLPFVSAGGSSMISTFIIVGILQSISSMKGEGSDELE
jgi:cell division protein FtsW